MTSPVLKNIRDCEDFLEGALWMGTGGGGSYQDGLKILTETLDEGLSLGWVDAESIDDDILTVTVGIHGSITPITPEVLEQAYQNGLVEAKDEWYLVKAVKELGRSLGQDYGCVVPAELGPESVAIPLAVGARMGIPVVDGDYVGRAVPEETQSTYCLYEKQSNLFAAVDRWGNSLFVRKAVNTHSLERMAKMLAIASYGEIAVATTPLIASEMKDIVVPKTLSTCLRIGRALRDARESHRDPIAAGLEVVKGWQLFEGTITGLETEDRDGYLFGTVEITGEQANIGHTLKIWFKNENLVSWLDEDPWVCSPDLFSILDRDGHGIYNSAIQQGDDVVIIGMRAPEAFRSEAGLSLMGPRYFGFDIDYQPIEDLVNERNPA